MQVFFGDPRAFALSPCALTIGNFDGVHLGHQQMLQCLRASAERHGLPTALLTFEPLPREFFARAEPAARLSALRDKLQFLAQSGWVDRVFVYRFNQVFSRMPATDFIHQVLGVQLHARYLLIGDDFQFGADRRGDFAMLSECPALVTEAMPSVLLDGERVSSSRIRTSLAAGDLAAARALSGRDYQLSGRVGYGQQLGRTIGFPTANVHLPHRRPPLEGIFVIQAQTAAGCFGGVASLGRNPTVSDGQRYRLEVHLFDFAGNLYGQRITVRFLQKLRDEAHYDDLSALVAQIEQDAAEAEAYLTRMQ